MVQVTNVQAQRAVGLFSTEKSQRVVGNHIFSVTELYVNISLLANQKYPNPFLGEHFVHNTLCAIVI